MTGCSKGYDIAADYFGEVVEEPAVPGCMALTSERLLAAIWQQVEIGEIYLAYTQHLRIR